MPLDRPARRFPGRPFGENLTMTSFRVWAPRARRVELVLRGDRAPPPRRARRARLVLGRRCPAPAPATTTPTPSTAARPGPTPGRRGSPRACTARRAWSTTPPSRGPTHGWQGGVPLAEAVVYELHVDTFTPEGTYEAAIAKLDHLVDLGVTDGRAAAGGRVPRPLGLGLRRRRPVRAQRDLRRARGAQAAGRRLPRPGPGRDPRRRLQPPRAVGELPGRVRALLHRPLRHAVGRGGQPRRARQRPGAGVRARQRPDVAAGLPRRRPAARRRPRHRRHLGLPHPRGDGRAGRRPGGRARPAEVPHRRERPERPAPRRRPAGRRLRHGRPVERRLPPRPARRAHRRAGRLLRRLRVGRPAGQGACGRRSCTTAATRRHRRRRHGRTPVGHPARPGSSATSRTTTRSATGPTASAAPC